MEQRTHDWLATLFYSPDKNIQELANLGITPDNSSLQSRDYYKNIPAIQEAFKTESGEFDHAKYNSFYNDVLYIYNAAEEANIAGNMFDTFEYDPSDIFAPIGAKRKDVRATIYQVPNPERRSVSLVSIGGISDPTMSIREVAQTSKVFNTETNSWEDWSPNDKGGLFGGLGRPTLVLAQWESDGTHEWNGRVFEHKAGDLKFNEYGDPYYETLGNRSISGKDVLHLSDTLTVDGSAWNKYDFFDSDGLDKSVVGTVAKTVFKVAPMFIPGVGQYYMGLTAAIEINQFLPVLYKSIAGIAYGDLSDNDMSGINQWQGYFERFESSQSDYARQAGFFTTENIAQIAGDAVLQLGQQRWISKLPQKFGGTMKIGDDLVPTENAIKWGRGLSFAYMSGTSAQYSYEAFKEAGASDRVAGLGMLGTAFAFYGLMSNNYFNYDEVLFGGSELSKSGSKAIFRDIAEDVGEKSGFNAAVKTSTKEGAAKFVLEVKDKVTQYVKNVDPRSLLSTASKEGFEESMEEVMQDVIKGGFAGLNALGIVDPNTKYDFGFDASDMASRYFTSFVGGAIGGATFGIYGKVEDWKNGVHKAVKESKHELGELFYLVRNGKEKELRKELEKLHRRGKLGSTNLSHEYELVKDGDTFVPKWLPAEAGKSQNDYIYNQLNNYLDYVSSIVKEEGLDLTDAQLAELSSNATLSDDEKSVYNAINKQHKRSTTDAMIASGIHSQIFQRINDLGVEIIQKKSDLEAMLTPKADQSKTPNETEAHIKAIQKSEEYKTAKAELEALRIELADIKAGKYNDKYFGLMQFAMRPDLANYFSGRFGKERWVEHTYGKYYYALSEEEQFKLDQEYLEYMQIEKAEIISAFEKFSALQVTQNEKLSEIASKMRAEELLHSGFDQYYLEQQNLKFRIAKNGERIKKLESELAEGETTSQEIEDLKQENKILNDALSNGAYSSLSQLVNLTAKGEEILRRNDVDYSDSYIRYLTHIRNNGLYLDHYDADMRNILRLYIQQINAPYIYQAWQEFVLNVINSELEEGDEASAYTQEYDATFNYLILAINQFISNLYDGNLKGAIEAYNSIINNSAFSELSSDLDFQTIAEFVNKILPNLGSYSVIDYLNILYDFKEGENNIKSSPVYDLIQSIATELGFGEDIVSLLVKYQKDFLNSPRVEEFIIQDASAIDKLKQLSKIINIARALTLASKEGNYNTSINPYRSALNKPTLVEISNLEYHNMIKEFNLIETQVETLVAIAEKNNAQKLREQKDIEINMRTKFLDLLVGTPTVENPDVRKSHMKDILKKELGIDIDLIIESLNIPIPNSVTEENLKEIVAITSAIETAIYEVAQNNELSIEKIVTTLFSAFDTKSELIKGKSTKLNKVANTVISDYDQLLYFATILGAPSQNFYSRLNEVTSDPNLQLAPIFSQEYASRMIYSFVKNPALFNGIVAELCKISSEIYGKNSQQASAYLATKSPMWNLFMVLGSAGVGKTQGVAKLSMAILGYNDVALCAPESSQVENLRSSISSDKYYDQQELITKILKGRDLTDDDVEEIIEGNSAVSRTLKPINDIEGNFIQTDTLIIDEISQFNRLQIELITRWAKKNNIRIIALGDSIQNSATHTLTKEINGVKITSTVNSSFDDMLGIKAPRLTAPLRPSNIGKYDNTIRLSSALELVDDHYLNNPAITAEKLDSFAEQEWSKAPIKLKFYENESAFYGDRIISPEDVSNYVKKFTSLVSKPEPDKEKPIAIITDKPQEFNSLSSELIEVVDHNKMQGREFDYVIVVKTFNSTGYKQLKDFYTLTQRSRKGTVIVKKGIPTYITSVSDPSAGGNTSVTQENIMEFKNWKLGILPAVTPEIDENTYVENESGNSNDDQLRNQGNPQPTPEPQDNQETSIQNTPESSQELPEEQPSQSSSIESVPKHIAEASRPVVPTSSPTYDVSVNTPSTIKCKGSDFMSWFNSKDNQYISQTREMFRMNKDDSYTHLMLLRAWFVYGHYKSGEKFPALPNFKREIVKMMNSNPKYEFKIANHILEVTINGKFKVPLLYVENIESGDFNGDIEVEKYHSSGTFGKKLNRRGKDKQFVSLNYIKIPYMIFSTPLVYEGPKQIWHDGMTPEELNSGNCFIMVNADPFSKVTFESIREVEDGNILKQSDTIQLFKINRLATVEDIFGPSGSYWLSTKKAYNKIRSGALLHGTTAGQMLAYAYKLDNKVLDNLRDVFDKHVVIIKIFGDGFKIKKTERFDNFDTLEKFIGENKEETFGIELEFNKANKSFIISGEEALVKLLYGEYKFEKYDELKLMISKSPYYNGGIFKNEKVYGNGWIELNNDSEEYSIDISTLYGNDFNIRISNISSNKPNTPSVVDEYNKQLSKLGIDGFRITSEDTISTTLDAINNHFKATTTSPIFNEIIIEDGKLTKITKTDWEVFISTKLNKPVQKVEFIHEEIDPNTLKYEGFLVTLPDGTEIPHIVENIDGELQIREIRLDLFSKMVELNNLLNETEWGNYQRARQYVKNLITNEPIDEILVNAFIKYVNDRDNQQVFNTVNLFLLEKLKQNEC